jgi:hypothetical protein
MEKVTFFNWLKFMLGRVPKSCWAHLIMSNVLIALFTKFTIPLIPFLILQFPICFMAVGFFIAGHISGMEEVMQDCGISLENKDGI